MAYLRNIGGRFVEMGLGGPVPTTDIAVAVNTSDPMPPEDPTSVKPAVVAPVTDPWAAPGPTGTVGQATSDFLKSLNDKLASIVSPTTPGTPTSSPIGGIPTPILIGAAAIGLWLVFGRGK